MSNEMYDALANYYREYSEKKSKYLESVDKLVINSIPDQAKNLLDVGAGDGVRGMLIAREKKIKRIILCDSSIEMVKKCRELNPSDVWQINAEDLPETNERFDVIICLWNVLGHIETREKRVLALTKMKNLLSSTGLIFFDVNNRHNASSYGLFKVIGRVIIDTINPDEKRGNTEYEWKIGKKVFPGMGHLFTPVEIKSIIKSSGLRVKSFLTINYNNGNVSKSFLNGQLFFVVSI